jgi:hypothetical protein
MISAKTLLQISVCFAYTLRVFILQCIRQDRTPEDVPTKLERECEDFRRETGRPVEEFVDIFAPVIVMALLQGSHYMSMCDEFSRENFAFDVCWGEDFKYYQVIQAMIYEGDFDARILEIIDAFIELLRIVNVRLILGCPEDDEVDDVTEYIYVTFHRFYLVFLEAYDPKQLLELSDEDIAFLDETRCKILG